MGNESENKNQNQPDHEGPPDNVINLPTAENSLRDGSNFSGGNTMASNAEQNGGETNPVNAASENATSEGKKDTDEGPGAGQSNRNFQDVRHLAMDDRGEIRKATGGTTGGAAAAVASGSRTFIILGWVSAILTAFVSPYFAFAGILFGVLANRQDRSSGNAVIITNIVLAAINVLFGLFFIVFFRRMIFGY